MTPAEAAEGRRLLEAHRLRNEWTDLEDWLWTNREELVRCAEVAADQPAPTETAHTCRPDDLSAYCAACDAEYDTEMASHALANPPRPRGGRCVDCGDKLHEGPCRR